MGQSNASSQAQKNVQTGQTAYNAIPSTYAPYTQEDTNFENQAQTNFNDAIGQANQTYGNVMSGYGNYETGLQNIQNQITAPTPYTPQTVSYETPAELTTAYGTLGNAENTFQNFANTGGFTPQGIQAMQSQAMSPITSAYGNAIQNLQQANTLGGGAANYVAAVAQAQRELPQQLSTAETGVNADLAQMIQQGELAGAQGLESTGSAQGGLANTAEGQELGAAIANQGAGLSAAELNNQQNQEYITNLLNSQGMQLGGLQGETSLYSATPGEANMFGSQVENAMNMQNQLLNSQNQYGLGLIQSMTGANAQDTSQPWYDTALDVVGDFINPLGSAIGSLFGPSPNSNPNTASTGPNIWN